MLKTFRASVAKIAEEHPEFRSVLVPLLKKKLATRVRDLGMLTPRGDDSREKAVKRIRQYLRWSREIIEMLDISLDNLEDFALKTTKTGEWPPVEDAYDIARSLGELEDVTEFWLVQRS